MRFDEICDEVAAIISGLDFPRPKPARRHSFRQCDVERILRASRKVGVPVRVDINRDGSVSLVPISTFPLTHSEADDIVARLA